MSNEIATLDTNSSDGLAVLWGGDDNIKASDVKTPEIRITQGNSEAVKAGLAVPGCIIFTYGSDDGNPTVLVGPGKHDPSDFVGYVIAREKFAATTKGGGLTFHDQPVRDLKDDKSWEGWFFYISVPEVDTTLPARTMVWKSNAPAARQINGFIQRAKARNDFDPIPVRFTTAHKSNDNGSWDVYRVALLGKDEVPADDLAIAESQRQIAMEMILNRQAYAANRPERVDTTDSDQPEV